LRHKKTQGGFQLDFFLISAAVIGSVICVLASLYNANTSGDGLARSAYTVFLFAASIGGGLALSFLGGGKRGDAQELKRQRERADKLEYSLKTLQDTADRREEFIASFAHELKTPLTAIIGYADMLRSKDMAPKPRFTAAGYIFSEGKRLEALSLKLMDIIVAGKQSIEKKRYDASYWLREIAAVTVPSVTDEGMKLEVYWENAQVELEPDLFKTLLINLVDNARKASHKGQTIELFGKNEEGGYAFYVRDYGRGMNKEDIAKITEPFYMIDKSRSRAQNGAGLGLALCQKIAELHGTTLEYSSAPGEGTTVRVLLRAGSERGGDTDYFNMDRGGVAGE
jgi:signal transduction histidine kinase